MLTPQALAREIDAGKFRAAYYLFGTDDHRIVEAEKFIARHFLPDRQLVVNYRKINARRTSCPDLITELSSLPLLGERQVFGITEFQNYKPTHVDSVLKMLTPSDSNRIVIFSSPSARMPKKNSAFYKTVSKFTVPVECAKLTLRETTSIVSKRLQQAELQIDPEALKQLVELISGSMGAVETEVAKLINYKQAGETIDITDIEKIAAGHEVYDVFRLADQIIENDVGHVMKMLNKLLEEGNSPGTLVSLLQSHFLSLYLVKNDKPPLGNLRWLVPRFRSQAAQYSKDHLEKIIEDLAEAASQLRGGNMTPRVIIEMLVLEILEKRKAIG